MFIPHFGQKGDRVFLRKRMETIMGVYTMNHEFWIIDEDGERGTFTIEDAAGRRITDVPGNLLSRSMLSKYGDDDFKPGYGD